MVRGPEDYAQDWIKMGIRMEKERKHEDAEDCFRRAIKFKPDLAEAWMHLGLVLRKLDREDEADEALSKARELDPSIVIEHTSPPSDKTKVNEEILRQFDPSYQRKVDDWIEMGLRLEKQGSSVSARMAFHKAIGLDTDSARAWVNLSTLLVRQERHKEASEAYAKAKSLDPSIEPDAKFITMAKIFFISPRKSLLEREAWFREQTNQEPNEPRAWVELAAVLGMQCKYKDAEDTIRKALELEDDYSQSWNILGVSLDKQQRHDEAIEAFKKALELDPFLVSTWTNLAISLNYQGKSDLAEAVVRHAININQYSSESWAVLGNTLSRLDRLVESENAYVQSINLEPSIWSYWCALGILLVKQQRYEEAKSALLRTVKLNPKVHFAWYHLGLSLLETGNLMEAEQALGKSIELVPNFIEAWMKLGTLLGKQQKYEEAEKAFEKAIEINPKSSAWRDLGLALEYQMKFTEAEVAYRRFLECDASNKEAWLALGNLLHRMDKNDEAEKMIRKSIEIDPQYGNGWYRLFLSLGKQGREKEAKAALNRALQLGYVPDTPTFDSISSKISSAMLSTPYPSWTDPRGKEDETEIHDESVPENSEELVERFIILREEFKYNKAEKLARKYIELNSHDPDGWNTLGLSLHEQWNHTEAEEAFKESIRLNPSCSIYWYNLWSTLTQDVKTHIMEYVTGTGIVQHAERTIQALVELYPNIGYGWVLLASAYDLQKKHQEESRALEKAAVIFRTRVAEYPSDAHSWFDLGDVLYKMGKYRKSVEVLRKAIRLDTEYAGIWLLLGNALMKQDNPVDAVKAFRKSIDINPNVFQTWESLERTLPSLGSYKESEQVQSIILTMKNISMHEGLMRTYVRTTSINASSIEQDKWEMMQEVRGKLQASLKTMIEAYMTDHYKEKESTQVAVQSIGKPSRPKVQRHKPSDPEYFI